MREKNTEKKNTNRTRRNTTIVITTIAIIIFLILGLWSCGEDRKVDTSNTTTEVAMTETGTATKETTEVEVVNSTDATVTEATSEEGKTTKTTTEMEVVNSTDATTTQPTAEEVLTNTAQATTQVTTEEARPTTEAVAPSVKPTTQATTEERTTQATTEAGCKHNWVEIMETKDIPVRDDNICKYCGYTTSDLSDIINHCGRCGGYWTHEELISAGWTEEDTIYKTRIGMPKGTTYTTKTICDTIEIGTGTFYCDKCWTTK